MTREDYLVLLLEENHLARMLTGLQYEEQKCLAQIQKVRHDLQANSKLPKIRLDAEGIKGVLKVQTNLINAHIQKTYGLEFKSFKVEDYDQVIADHKAKQVQEQENALQRSEVRQQEGGAGSEQAGPNDEVAERHSSPEVGASGEVPDSGK